MKFNWDEWHAWVIGWGDGVAFLSTDWEEVMAWYGPNMGEEIHYYKFGLAMGRLTWALIIGSLLLRFLG